ncbi:MAG: DUF4160 domain-containing protein [Glaciimonas sp.]|nr:DUF4160 domain-containing protein [Glaciimonas sp.]
MHVRGRDGEAKFWLHPTVHLGGSDGFGARTLRELAEVVDQNTGVIERAWNDWDELDEDIAVAGLLAGHGDSTRATMIAA